MSNPDLAIAARNQLRVCFGWEAFGRASLLASQFFGQVRPGAPELALPLLEQTLRRIERS
jgi:hypothetical protein